MRPIHAISLLLPAFLGCYRDDARPSAHPDERALAATVIDTDVGQSLNNPYEEWTIELECDQKRVVTAEPLRYRVVLSNHGLKNTLLPGFTIGHASALVDASTGELVGPVWSTATCLPDYKHLHAGERRSEHHVAGVAYRPGVHSVIHPVFLETGTHSFEVRIFDRKTNRLLLKSNAVQVEVVAPNSDDEAFVEYLTSITKPNGRRPTQEEFVDDLRRLLLKSPDSVFGDHARLMLASELQQLSMVFDDTKPLYPRAQAEILTLAMQVPRERIAIRWQIFTQRAWYDARLLPTQIDLHAVVKEFREHPPLDEFAPPEDRKRFEQRLSGFEHAAKRADGNVPKHLTAIP